MRARSPDREGYAESHGVPVSWQIHGDGDRTVLFAPTWQIYDSRVWRMQIPYDFDRCADDALAVMDATDTARASLVCFSRGTHQGIILAAEHPARVERLVLIGSPVMAGVRSGRAFSSPRARYDGWEKFNAHYFPLRNHFEQYVHVPHRLARYGAGTRMDYHRTEPETLAHAIADGLEHPVLYRDVETDGARRAAASIAPLL